jgi:hypothetical protein
VRADEKGDVSWKGRGQGHDAARASNVDCKRARGRRAAPVHCVAIARAGLSVAVPLDDMRVPGFALHRAVGGFDGSVELG